MQTVQPQRLIKHITELIISNNIINTLLLLQFALYFWPPENPPKYFKHTSNTHPNAPQNTPLKHT